MNLDPLLWWNCLGSGLGEQESFRVRPGDVGVARAPRTCAWAFYLSSRTPSMGPVRMDWTCWTLGPWIDLRILILCLGGLLWRGSGVLEQY